MFVRLLLFQKSENLSEIGIETKDSRMCDELMYLYRKKIVKNFTLYIVES